MPPVPLRPKEKAFLDGCLGRTVVGLGCAIFCMWLMAIASWRILGLMFLLAVVAAVATSAQARRRSRLGELDATMTLPASRFRQRLTLQVRLPVVRRSVVRLEARLLVRELGVRVSGTSGTNDRDHLLEEYLGDNETVEAGGCVELQHQFLLHPAPLRRLGAGAWPVRWVMQLQAMMGDQLALEEEYELPFTWEELSGGGLEQADPHETDYSVVFRRVEAFTYAKVIAVISELRSDLTAAEIKALLTAAPAVVLADVDRYDAERARVRLEAVAAEVEVRRCGVVVPKRSAEALPIPAQRRVAGSSDLPRPASEPE